MFELGLEYMKHEATRAGKRSFWEEGGWKRGDVLSS